MPLAALVATFAVASLPRPPTESPAEEIASIQEHLRGAEAVLAAADVSALSSEQRARRAVHAQRLAEYRARGEFPKNRGLGIPFTPIFRDPDGTLCAMGHLLWESGEHALVNRIAATRNLATIHELADEPGLAEWLRREGLTLDEAARIQPSYWDPQIRFATDPQTVAVGSCSKAITVEVTDWAGDRRDAYVRAEPKVALYGDANCRQRLEASPPTDWQLLPFADASSSASFHFIATAPGDVEISVGLGMTTIRQTHSVIGVQTSRDDPRTPDGQDPDYVFAGCAHTSGNIAWATAALAVLLAAAGVRRRRARVLTVPRARTTTRRAAGG